MSKVDSLLAHELQLQRVATELLRKGLYPSLDAAYKAIRAILLEAETITSPTKLRTVERAITKAVNEALEKGWSEYTKELEKIAIYDASWYAQLIGAGAVTMKVPGKRSIADYVQSALMSLSSGQIPKVGLWADFVRENISGYAEQVNNLVKAGYVNNATVQQTARTIKQFSEGLAKQQAEILARTGLRHYSEQAREAMAQDNLDVIEKRYYLSVFDNRRTVTCASLHSRTWDIDDDSYVRLPAHYGCRSVYLYLLKGQSQPGGEMPALGSGENYPEDADRKPKDRGRASTKAGIFKPEQIKANSGVDSWLRKQDRAFVIDNLGATRAKLFLDGGLPINRMADAWGRPLKLEDLITKEREAFRKAGLIPKD